MALLPLENFEGQLLLQEMMIIIFELIFNYMFKGLVLWRIYEGMIPVNGEIVYNLNHRFFLLSR